MMKYSGCFSNRSSESSAPLRRPPHFPFGISAASCSRWVNLSSQHPPIFNGTLPHTYIHKKKRDAIHASRGGWMEAVFADLHRRSWDMQSSSSQRSERSARGKTRQDCDSSHQDEGGLSVFCCSSRNGYWEIMQAASVTVTDLKAASSLSLLLDRCDGIMGRVFVSLLSPHHFKQVSGGKKTDNS